MEFTNEKLKLKFDPAKTTLEDILKNVADIGYDSEKLLLKMKFMKIFIIVVNMRKIKEK